MRRVVGGEGDDPRSTPVRNSDDTRENRSHETDRVSSMD